MNSSRPLSFSERDSVVIADFANSTGAAVFDDTLKEALEVQLRQSPFLSVLSDQQVQGTLRLMARAGDRLTPDVAREICQRTGSKAMVAGAISQLGQSYVISLDASNCRTGETIEKQQVQAAGKDDVLKALGAVAERLRRGLGESLASIEKYDAPIQGATTASLDALKSYSLGMTTRRRDGDAASLPFFRKALEQDPDFALAHARLSVVYSNMGEGELSRVHITRAYALKDRVSEPERLYITARYYTTVEASVQKTIDAYQVWIQTYPNDFVPHANLAVAYSERSEFEKAAAEYRAAIALAPDQPLPYANLSGVYSAMNKPDEARRTLEDAIKRGLDSTGFRGQLYVLAFYRGDEAEMTRQIEAARRFPDGFTILTAQVSVAMCSGQLALAKELTARFASEAASKTGLKGSTATLWSTVAQSAALFGDAASTRASVRTSLDVDRNFTTLLNSAFALAAINDWRGAQNLVDEAVKLPDAANGEPKRGVALVSALIRHRQGDPRAIEGIPAPKDDTDFGAIFTLGAVHLSRGNAERAAEQFKKIVDRHEPSTSSLKPLAWLYYARALARMDRSDESRRAYDQFFKLWKDADANLPVLVSAKQEYARLISTH